jgi:hypothetical protein
VFNPAFVSLRCGEPWLKILRPLRAPVQNFAAAKKKETTAPVKFGFVPGGKSIFCRRHASARHA